MGRLPNQLQLNRTAHCHDYLSRVWPFGRRATKTSTLRHLIQELGADSIVRIEPIDPAVFSLTNEFWVSYYILDQIFDKKFIFTPGSFDPAHLRYIPELGLEGVLHS